MNSIYGVVCTAIVVLVCVETAMADCNADVEQCEIIYNNNKDGDCSAIAKIVSCFSSLVTNCDSVQYIKDKKAAIDAVTARHNKCSSGTGTGGTGTSGTGTGGTGGTGTSGTGTGGTGGTGSSGTGTGGTGTSGTSTSGGKALMPSIGIVFLTSITISAMSVLVAVYK